MSTSEDVKTLFRRFGGQPETYQEVVRERQAVQSLGKWAMLGQVELGNPQAIPSVRRAVKTGATRPPAEAFSAPVAQPLPAPVAAAPAPLPAVPAVVVPAPVMAAPAPVVAAPAPVVAAPAPVVAAPAPVAAAQPAPPVVVAAPVALPAAPVQVAPLPRALPMAAMRMVAAPAPVPALAPASTFGRPPAVAAPSTPLFRPAAPAPASARVSPLAARLKGQTPPAEAPVAAGPAGSHSLPGLFGRLAGPQADSPRPGLLRRKFTK